MNPRICPGCGVDLDPIEGPVHRYMESTPACWAKYGDLLAREYSDPAYMAAHRMTVDTYAVQHPGRPTPQAIQSVAVHLISLHAVLELGFPPRRATELIQVLVEMGGYRWLDPLPRSFPRNVLHPLHAQTAKQHRTAVQEWAESTWKVWESHHETVRAWARRCT